MIQVYKIGTFVLIGYENTPITGIINKILFTEGGGVLYKIVWWSGRDRREEWIASHEIRVLKKKEMDGIGFINAD